MPSLENWDGGLKVFCGLPILPTHPSVIVINTCTCTHTPKHVHKIHTCTCKYSGTSLFRTPLGPLKVP